jgi:RNA polymerase sigma factor (sigma-70 family)
MRDSDLQLLAQYSTQNAEDAFAEIVRRHLDLVFSAALRQVRSPQLAEEVAQSAFADLARQAHRLAPDTVLPAWLYQVTRRTAIDVVRREARRQQREHIVSQIDAMNATNDDWAQVEPLLDEAMHALDDSDRTAVLLRYFENKSLREVGETLGTNEDAARKRVQRAVERLREFFTQRGITIGAGGLAGVIATNAIQAAPMGLAPAITTSASVAGTTAATVVKAGVAAKSAASFGLLGGLFALLGGAFLTLRAQADDTKSPRERQFIVQMIGVRLAATVLILMVFYGVLKLDFSRQPLAHDAVMAAFLFVSAAVATISFDHTRRGQRQIQMEEDTLVEAEWKRPRRETEPSSGPNGNNSELKTHLKSARSMAVGVVISAMMAIQAPWKQYPVEALMILALLALAVFLSWRRWRNRPRFERIGLKGMVCMCVLTLLGYNIHQYKSGLGAANGTPSAVVILFNLAVMLIYAAFIGIYALKRQREFRSPPLP